AAWITGEESSFAWSITAASSCAAGEAPGSGLLPGSSLAGAAVQVAAPFQLAPAEPCRVPRVQAAAPLGTAGPPAVIEARAAVSAQHTWMGLLHRVCVGQPAPRPRRVSQHQQREATVESVLCLLSRVRLV